MPKRKKGDCRAFVLSEFGGYSHAVQGHVWNPGKVFGYRIYRSPGALRAACAKLYEKRVRPLLDKGLSAAVYTQVSDVEREVNGLMTYDREIVKVSKSRI